MIQQPLGSQAWKTFIFYLKQRTNKTKHKNLALPNRFHQAFIALPKPPQATRNHKLNQNHKDINKKLKQIINARNHK